MQGFIGISTGFRAKGAWGLRRGIGVVTRLGIFCIIFYRASETSEDLSCEYGSEALQGLVSGFGV